MKRPQEHEYTSHVAYSRALEAYCNLLEQPAQDEPFGYYKPGEGDYEKVFNWQYNERTGYTEPLYTRPGQPAQDDPVALKKGECWPEYVMQEWDYWRKQIADGDKGSAPRDWFEELAELKLVSYARCEMLEMEIKALEEKLAEAREQPAQDYTTTRNAWTGRATHKCNHCGRDDFRSEHAAKFHKCEALEQPAQDKPIDAQKIVDGFFDYHKQPAQEPVAWVCYGSSSDEKHAVDYEQHEIDSIPVGTLLYTRPAREPQPCPYVVSTREGTHHCSLSQREWVGLTDEEIKEIVGPWGPTPIKSYTRKLFDAIEAKLREKNS